MTGFGDKEMSVGYCGANGQVISDSGGDGVIDGDSAAGIIFQGTDVNLVFFNVFSMQISQLGNTHAGLEKKLNDGGHTDVQTDGVA